MATFYLGMDDMKPGAKEARGPPDAHCAFFRELTAGMQKADRHAIGIIRDAFVTLEDNHPELVVKISAAMTASGSKDLVGVEAAFREAAVALVPVDKEAAETIFTLAEVLAQTYLRRSEEV